MCKCASAEGLLKNSVWIREASAATPFAMLCYASRRPRAAPSGLVRLVLSSEEEFYAHPMIDMSIGRDTDEIPKSIDYPIGLVNSHIFVTHRRLAEVIDNRSVCRHDAQRAAT